MTRRLLVLVGLCAAASACGLQSRPRSPAAAAHVADLRVSVRAGSPVLSWRGQPTEPFVRFQVQRRQMPVDPNDAAPRFEVIESVPVTREVLYAFVDNELEAGRQYQYRVRAMPAEGKERRAGRAGARYAGGQVSLTWDPPPAAPAGVDLHPVLGGIQLTWQPVPEASGYRVYRLVKDRSVAAHVRLLEEPTFTDLSPDAGQHPYVVRAVRVRAVKPVELEGPSSAPAQLEPVEALAPPPQGLVAVRGTGGVQLSWKPHPDAPEGTRYHVYRQAVPPQRLTTDPIPATTFTDKEAPAGAIAYFVVAVDALGREGPHSAAAKP